jgi:hypothetical protein
MASPPRRGKDIFIKQIVAGVGYGYDNFKCTRLTSINDVIRKNHNLAFINQPKHFLKTIY